MSAPLKKEEQLVRGGGLTRGDFAQGARRLFGRSGGDVEAGAPLEPGHLGELGHELDVPVEVKLSVLAHGGGVEDEVVGGAVEHAVPALQEALQCPPQLF